MLFALVVLSLLRPEVFAAGADAPDSSPISSSWYRESPSTVYFPPKYSPPPSRCPPPPPCGKVPPCHKSSGNPPRCAPPHCDKEQWPACDKDDQDDHENEEHGNRCHKDHDHEDDQRKDCCRCNKDDRCDDNGGKVYSRCHNDDQCNGKDDHHDKVCSNCHKDDQCDGKDDHVSSKCRKDDQCDDKDDRYGNVSSKCHKDEKNEDDSRYNKKGECHKDDKCDKDSPCKCHNDEDCSCHNHRGTCDKDFKSLNCVLLGQYVLSDIYRRAAFNNAGNDNVRDMISTFYETNIKQTSMLLGVLKNQAVAKPTGIDVSNDMYAKAMDKAFGVSLLPPFEAYNSSAINKLIALYTLGPSMLASFSAAAIPTLHNSRSQALVAGILSSASGQDGAIRAVLRAEGADVVEPYNYTVSDFTSRISAMQATIITSANVSGSQLSTLSSSNVSQSQLRVDEAAFGISRSAEDVVKMLTSLGVIQ